MQNDGIFVIILLNDIVIWVVDTRYLKYSYKDLGVKIHSQRGRREHAVLLNSHFSTK
jgi:hypothetical protein